MTVFLFSAGCMGRPNHPFTGHAASVDGAEIYYEVHGDRTPLLLLHGFGGSTTIWREFVPELAKHYRVINIDLRGHGRSTNPGNQFTHRKAADDILMVMDRLNLGRVKAIGMSSGGMALLHLAKQNPGRVEAIVLIGGTSHFTEQARAIMRDTSFDALPAKQLIELRALHPRGDPQIRALMEQFRNFRNSYDDVNFTAKDLSAITARTLIIHGDRDEFFPVGIPMGMYRAIPRSYLWIVPNSEHIPISSTNKSSSRAQREAFLQTVLEFLSGSWP
jgi:pimeloyl-ACP methyl ester carboxylesterase